MRNKIIYVMKDAIHLYPPCLSQIKLILLFNVKISLIVEECDNAVAQLLREMGVEVNIIGCLNKKSNFWGKVSHWMRFRWNASKLIKRFYKKGDVVWFGSAGTAIALKKSVSNRKYVMSVLELYDRYPFYKKGIAKLAPNASAVIACELNRARIMKIWYGLRDLPFVMPNKPYFELQSECSAKIESLRKILKEKDVVLYQGILSNDRSLQTIAAALKLVKKRYTLVIIGRAISGKEEKILNDLKELYDDILYGGFFPAPQHLLVTEMARIGVAIYDSSSINNMLCAPNKIFEYSKYGVPIIGSDIPGLQLTVEKNLAGICVNTDSPSEIARAIEKIDNEYDVYSSGARRLYTSVDNKVVVEEILHKLNLM
jgi:glycosyltransferase involved in cell wall biosynthesis